MTRLINAVLAFFGGGSNGDDAIPMHTERRQILINYETRG
jgi:hypothetical protein